MELVLKLHGKMPPDAFDIQERYGDSNIGFSKLFEMEKLGLKPSEDCLPPDEALARCVHEGKEGRFVLVSLPTESRKSLFEGGERIADDSNHIFVSVVDSQGLKLICHSYQALAPFVFSDIDKVVARIISLKADFRINFVTYCL
jgi:hypothetical protein